MKRRTAAAVGIPVVTALVAGAAIAAVWQPWREVEPDVADSGPATVVAERATLTSGLLLSGELGYGEEVALPGRSGTVTWLPDSGAIVGTGQMLYEVDGRPVIAVRGSRPFWRELRQGASGPDVEQLEVALVELGFGGDLAVDQDFTWATAAAVRAWQSALGIDDTGVVSFGDIVAIDASSVRVAAVTARLGDQAHASPMTYTSTTIRAIADLTDAQARELVAPIEVAVRLPDGSEIAGTITVIDPGGEPTGERDERTSASAVVEFPDQAAVEGVGLRAVKVIVARDEVADALVVPVTALIATLDGSYAVDVVRGDEIARIPVELGLIADTRVQIVGGELAEGDEVVVAS